MGGHHLLSYPDPIDVYWAATADGSPRMCRLLLKHFVQTLEVVTRQAVERAPNRDMLSSFVCQELTLRLRRFASSVIEPRNFELSFVVAFQQRDTVHLISVGSPRAYLFEAQSVPKRVTPRGGQNAGVFQAEPVLSVVPAGSYLLVGSESAFIEPSIEALSDAINRPREVTLDALARSLTAPCVEHRVPAVALVAQLLPKS